MQQVEQAAVVSQEVITSDKDEVVHDEALIFEVSCLMPAFTVVCRIQVFLPVQIRKEGDGISSEVDCKVVDIDDEVKQVHLVQEVVEPIAVGLVCIQVSPKQVVDNKEQVALTCEVSKMRSMKYKSLVLKYTRSKSETSE